MLIILKPKIPWATSDGRGLSLEASKLALKILVEAKKVGLQVHLSPHQLIIIARESSKVFSISWTNKI